MRMAAEVYLALGSQGWACYPSKAGMGSAAGTTTVTEAAASVARVAARGSALVWLFPRSGGAAVGLHRNDVAEQMIGRDEACAVHLTGNDVSRRHAVLRTAPEGGVTLADLGSRNGVRLNGRP